MIDGTRMKNSPLIIVTMKLMSTLGETIWWDSRARVSECAVIRMAMPHSRACRSSVTVWRKGARRDLLESLELDPSIYRSMVYEMRPHRMSYRWTRRLSYKHATKNTAINGDIISSTRRIVCISCVETTFLNTIIGELSDLTGGSVFKCVQCFRSSSDIRSIC